MTTKEILAVLITKMESIEGDVKDIKEYTGRINGGLRDTQNDVTAIQTNCLNCTDQIKDFRSRMNVFTVIATAGGGILGYIGSYFK
jgi:predicted  nucleic acid-binding Zn-ribbon protein